MKEDLDRQTKPLRTKQTLGYEIKRDQHKQNLDLKHNKPKLDLVRTS